MHWPFISVPVIHRKSKEQIFLLFMYRTVCYMIISLDFCYFRNFATENPNQHEKTVLQKKPSCTVNGFMMWQTLCKITDTRNSCLAYTLLADGKGFSTRCNWCRRCKIVQNLTLILTDREFKNPFYKNENKSWMAYAKYIFLNQKGFAKNLSKLFCFRGFH
jgi:hypothetical protein